MARPRKCIATKSCLTLALLCIAATVRAESVGTVTGLEGSLLARSANGALKVLALDSALEQGDTIASRARAYARVTLADGSVVTLGPDTELRIEKYSFREARPQSDAALLVLTTGRVRIAAGLLGRRGNADYTLATPSATIDIRGSTFIAEYLVPDHAETVGQYVRRPVWQAAIAADGYTATAVFEQVSMRSFDTPVPLVLAQNTGANIPGRAPGLYVQVQDGAIILTNRGGTQNFAAGQFGFTPSFKQPPVVLPNNPGLQFTPPPSFSSTTGSPGGTSGGKSPAVDCVVR
jgi:hypothetical protein